MENTKKYFKLIALSEQGVKINWGSPVSEKIIDELKRDLELKNPNLYFQKVLVN